MHLRKTRILVLWNKLEFCIVSGHFPSPPWPRRMVRGLSGRNHRVSNWHVPCKNRSFVWFAERPLLTAGQCRFLRQILCPALEVLPPLYGARFYMYKSQSKSHNSLWIVWRVVIRNLNFLALVIKGVLFRLDSRLGGLWPWGTGNLCCINTLISARWSRVPRQ